MIKIIKNPNEKWEGKTELYGHKYIFMTNDFSDGPAYAKIGFRSLIGYIIIMINIRRSKKHKK